MLCGEKILALRKKRGYTQETLAERLSVSRQAISRWESDQAMPDGEKLVPLGRLLGVSADYLLDDGQPVAEAEKPEPESVPRRKGHGEKISTALLAIGLALILLLALLPCLIPPTVMRQRDVIDSSQVRTEALGENAAEGTENTAAMRYVCSPEKTYGFVPFLSGYHLWPVFCLGCLAAVGGALGKMKRR